MGALGRAQLQVDQMKSQRELQSKAKKQGLFGSIGGSLGALGLVAALNPVGLLATAAVAGIGSMAGNLGGRMAAAKKVSFTPTKDALADTEYGHMNQGARGDIIEDANVSMMKSAGTTAMLAGGGEFMKEFAKAGQVAEGGEKMKFLDKVKQAGGTKNVITPGVKAVGVPGDPNYKAAVPEVLDADNPYSIGRLQTRTEDPIDVFSFFKDK